MNLFYKCRGSVSIFLVIILVPVIVVCSVFVDASRIKLAKSLVNSAGDLTLNSALSYYDLELNDYYGLLASSQSEEEFLTNSQTYFEACMVSQGISTTDAAKWAESLKEIVEGKSDIVDLLQIEVGDSYSLSPVEGANLANATIIKSDIVDFMKYRAPIELLAEGANIIGKLEKVGEVEEIIPVETKLQDEKQDYYEAESEVLKICGDIYIDLNAYDEKGMTEARLKAIKEKLDSLHKEYEELHKLTVKNLYNGENKGGFRSVDHRMLVNPDAGSYSDAGAGTLNGLIGNCRKAIEDYENKKTALQAKIDMLPFKDYQQTYYDIQYWVQTEKAITKEYESFISSIQTMQTAQAKLENAYANREVREEEWDYEEVEWVQVQAAYDVKDEYSGEGYGTIEQSYNDVDSQISRIKEHIKNLELGDISKISRKLEEISDLAGQKGVMKSDPITKRLATISTEMSAYEKEIKECEDLLKEIDKNFGKLEKAVKKYDEEYSDWKGFAELSSPYEEDSDIVDTDLHEIAVLEGKEEPTRGEQDAGMERVKINLEEVSVCRERVNNVRHLLGTYTDSIHAFTYGGKEIKDIKKYSTLKNKSGIEEEKIVISNEKLDEYAKTSFEAVFREPADTDYEKVTNDNNPSFTINKPKFYEWLHTKFDGKNLTDKNKAKNALEKMREKMEEEKKNQETEPDRSEISSNEIKDKKPLPSGSGGGSALGSAGGESIEEVSNTTSLFGSLNLKNILNAGRDNLYATSYIMSMFSYDTYVKENKYKLAQEAGEKVEELTPKNCTAIYNKYESQWKSEDTTFTANKTLTNKMQNLANNYAFGNEVEYIIYGGSNTANKLSSYGTIFGIRYAMNIAPVFKQYWNKNEVNSIAGIISTATSGIIPVSLIKLVICLGMTAAETAVDISYLKAGLPVLFIKKYNKDLFLQLNFEEVAEGATELVGGIGGNNHFKQSKEMKLSYSEYLTLFLFISLCGKGQQNIYLRTADVIQCNMQQRNNSYLMSNAYAYYELNANMRVKPMMLATPWSRQSGSGVLDTTTWNTFNIQQIRGY